VLGKFDYKLTTQENELALLTSATLDSAIRYMEFGKADSTVLGIKLLENKLNNPKNIFIPEDRMKMETDLDRKTRLLRLLYQMKVRHNAKLDASAYDDILQKDTLHLLKGKEYEISFRAKDVIHSAYFPHLRAQINTVPGQVTRLKVTPTISTKEMRVRKNNPKFNYVLMCNKICGSAHYKMKMIVVIDTPQQYNAWLKSKTTFRDDYLKPATVVSDSTSAVASVGDTTKMGM
jgi:cytochrome c oxidase subunit 2